MQDDVDVAVPDMQDDIDVAVPDMQGDVAVSPSEQGEEGDRTDSAVDTMWLSDACSITCTCLSIMHRISMRSWFSCRSMMR